MDDKRIRTIYQRFRDGLSALTNGRVPPYPPIVGVLRLDGIIAPQRRFGTLNIASLADTIERLFKLPNLVAVALVVNSPGGSPAQSSLVHARLRARARALQLPVFAFAEDVAASGGYWLALAGDEIWVKAGSLVGSIGVVTAGFGFTELIRRIGIERRLHTAGAEKSMLDPFRRESPEEVERLARIHADLHEIFKSLVRERRGERLKEDERVFSGAIYTGRQAVAQGLADGIGDVDEIMRQRFGERVRLRALGPRRRSWLARQFGRARSPDWSEIGGAALGALEDRLHWARWGL